MSVRGCHGLSDVLRLTRALPPFGNLDVDVRLGETVLNGLSLGAEIVIGCVVLADDFSVNGWFLLPEFCGQRLWEKHNLVLRSLRLRSAADGDFLCLF